jgi:ketosteroid isomerase-like protein
VLNLMLHDCARPNHVAKRGLADEDCQGHSFELVAAGASGDLAYTTGYERFSTSIDGHPATPMALRVTHVYRRENGEWKIVHRHADTLMPDQTAPAEAPTAQPD